MQNQAGSNIALSFFNIHNVITRGLMVSIESIHKGMMNGIHGENDREGLFNYIRALVSVLNAHHLTEDEIAFPYFREKLPDAPFDALTKHHRVMVALLDKIKESLEKCEKMGSLDAEWEHLESALARMNKMWHPHIKIETETFITKADALLPVEEQLRLVRQFSEHGQKNAIPAYLTVPFLLYNLPENDRKLFMQGMPSEVLDNLVPIVWKEQWVSMTPYFLI
jgi:hemerythrin-like domain-containing protein